ncbi:MAG: HAD-IA family hydrolase [Eubacterium sp.]|nr:HAD-IA family hydrolase [Eubacterium sp.]
MYEHSLYEIKKKIRSQKYTVVSFDIFDTLILRPLLRPSDLFYIMNQFFIELTKTNLNFACLRMECEKAARRREAEKGFGSEDITLEEIYTYMHKQYGISIDVVRKLKEYEEELEIELSMLRYSAEELYKYAYEQQKKVILVSDMYLERNVVEQILFKNKITLFHGLFLSSEVRKLKKTGSMYDKVLEALSVSAEEILHIGDNYDSDYLRAKETGIDAVFFPKTSDIFYSGKKDLNQFHFRNLCQKGCFGFGNLTEIEKSVGFGSMIAFSSHKFCNDPYLIHNIRGDLDGNPEIIGYFFMGMYAMGIVQWISEEIKRNRYEKIWFSSRDGWLFMEVYKIMCMYDKKLPEPGYLYVSRESTLPIQLANKAEYFQIPVEIKKYSPETMCKLLEFSTVNIEKHELEYKLKQEGIRFEECFVDQADFLKFMHFYLKNLYLENKHLHAKELCRKYFKQIKSSHVIFDMGYSARVQNAICRILEQKLNILFLYRNPVDSFYGSHRNKICIRCFYDLYPNITGMIREYFLSEIADSCVGYQEQNGKMIPLFRKELNKNNAVVIKTIQEHALMFVKDYYTKWGKHWDDIHFQSKEVILPMEGFLMHAKEEDIHLFVDSYASDSIYGRNDNMNIARFWKTNLRNMENVRNNRS